MNIRETVKDLEPSAILKVICPYVWLVHDEDTHGIWVYYDGETARKFMYMQQRKTRHRMTIGTQDIVDIK